MAIKIQTKTPHIPIEIGDELELRFYVTDDNIEKLFNGYDEMLKKYKDVEIDNAEKGKMILKDAIDYILGDGSFDKLYGLSNSVLVTKQYFDEIVDGLSKEITKRYGDTNKEKVEKYLQNKKKQNQTKSKSKK